MNNFCNPRDQVFWHLQKNHARPPLRHTLKTDVVVVGGGMAGMSAAQSFKAQGLSVALIERWFCGAGATGKSSGYITPNSELGLEHFVATFGPERARLVWEFVTSGVSYIRNNILNYHLACDYEIEDTVVVANSARGFRELEREHKARQSLGYESNLYSQQAARALIGSDSYFGALRYGDTFALNAYYYIQEMKNVLLQQGVQIFEETPALSIEDGIVETPHARIHADAVVVCVDRFLPGLCKLRDKVYQVQTFVLMSEPLQDAELHKLFPQGPQLVWDTDLVYNYYRIADNNRLTIGGADMLSSFWGSEQHDLQRVERKLAHYIASKFPDINVRFNYFWPGLIGISKDLAPIAGFDKDMPRVYYVTAATGLPWAAALGWYSAQRIVQGVTTFDDYFSPYRSFPLPECVQKIVGKRVAFSLSNLISLKA